MKTRQVDETTQARIEAMWPAEDDDAGHEQLLDRVAAALAIVDDKASEVIAFCGGASDVVTLPEFPVLTDEQQPAFLRDNLRLVYGRWLAQHRFYDESIQQLSGLSTSDVVDPSALLFYLGTGYHRMPNKTQCLPVVAKLLENQTKIPRRYATVAMLIQADLQPLKTDSLDEISRLMDEVRRRLDLKRRDTGPTTRG